MQDCPATRRNDHEHFATILFAMQPLQSAAFNETIYKFRRTVMAKAELPGECGDGRTSARGQAHDCQKKLVLLGFDALGAGCVFAEVQELPYTVPELSKPAKTGF